MSAGMKKETEQLVRDLRKQGFTVELTGSNHWKVSHPERPGCAYMAYTPSDRRSILNSMKGLRRLGYVTRPDHSRKKGKKGKK